MRKLLLVLFSTLQGRVRGGLLFVALLATTVLLAQDSYFQVGDLYYHVTSTTVPYTVEVIDCNTYATSIEIPSTISIESHPNLPLPGMGKVTICVQVPEVLCEGSMVVIPGYLTSWDTGDAIANGQATQLVEGTNNWYAGTFDWQPDDAFKIAHCKPNGIWNWEYQAASGELLEGDLSYRGYDITTDMVINSDNQVIYISVYSWAREACWKTNEAGTATFNLTAEGFAAEAQFAIAGSGLAAGAWACPPPAEHIMTALGGGKYTLTLDVPAGFQYKYLVDEAGDGNWQWYSAANYNMPVSLVANDIEEYYSWYVNDVNDKKNINSSENDERTITYTITSIGSRAFAYCSSLTTITIPNTVTSIGFGAFYGCSSLTSITIPNGVTMIRDYTFYNCYNLNSVSIPDNVTSIGVSAFYNCAKLRDVTLPSKLKMIESNAFGECPRLYEITCYAQEPPFAYESSFTNYDAYFHAYCDAQRHYSVDPVWKKFHNVECLVTENTVTNNVTITPSDCEATVVWLSNDAAAAYSLVITKNGTTFCTLRFNKYGQLTNIAFSPSRTHNNKQQSAETTETGYSFTITGLDAGTRYDYQFSVLNDSNESIDEYFGDFTTHSTTAVENTHCQSSITNCQKIIRNDQLLILRDGKTYTVMGQKL